MPFSWLSWDNPVAFWWVFLVATSVGNILAWGWTNYFLWRARAAESPAALRWALLLSGAYVFGCAFRSFLPRADVQRICLFDTWWSSVFVGRSVATVAELGFVALWALVLHCAASHSQSRLAARVAQFIVPLIFVAECFSWFAVITTNYIGNTVEESLWTISYTLITIALIDLWFHFQGALRYATGLAALGSLLYVLFMVSVDVPMYFHRWLADQETNKIYLGFWEGLRDLNARWTVTHDIQELRTEIPWMSLYFSVAVQVSILLCYFPFGADRIRRYLK